VIRIPGFDFFLSDLGIAVLIFTAINVILLFIGVGKLAIFGALDSLIYLFAPAFALKSDYLKYYPGYIKDKDGKTKKTFRTPRDEFYPGYAPFHERLGDFCLRFPLFSFTFFLLLSPLLAKHVGPYFDKVVELITPLSKLGWVPYKSNLFRLFVILFFMPFSSIHSTLVSVYTVIVYPLKTLFKAVLPMCLFVCMFVLLFALEVTLIYVGFLPLFHQGIIPFLDAGAGLKQFIFWMPVKFRIYVDLILAPIVIVVPLITTIGSYILSRHDAVEGEKKIDYVVLFYRTGISYLYAPLLSKIFPKLGEEARQIREERKINEMLVVGMYLESLVCVAGTGYAYVSLAKTSNVPLSGILLGILVLVVFVPMIVFSSNGFQSFFLDKAITVGEKIRESIVPGKGS